MITRNKRKELENKKEEDEESEEEVLEPKKKKLKIFKIINNDDSEDEEEPTDIISSMENEIKNSDKTTYKNFLEVKKELEDREPNILTILNTELDIKDKANLIELYEIYKTTSPFNEEHIIFKSRINKMFTQAKIDYQEYKNLSPQMKRKYKKHLQLLDTNTSCLKSQILSLETSQENLKIILKKYNDLKEVADSEEYGKLKNWLKWCVSIPHNKFTIPTFNGKPVPIILKEVSDYMDKELYGMKNVKEQLLLFLNTKLQYKDAKGCSIGLIGPPGVGKTSIAKCLSKCLSYPFSQISFGGVTNSEFLMGHDYTYIGSRPGEITRSLSRLGSKNGILFFDEFDKVSDKKDICSSLLHITDFSQNNSFRDNYLADITIDLSYIWFIYSMNNHPEDSALRDRIFTIEVGGYNTDDKLNIIKNHILPKTLRSIGRLDTDIKVKDQTLRYFISKIDSHYERGIRNIERNIRDMVNKIHFIVTISEDDTNNKFITSFNSQQKLKYPVELTQKMVDDFTSNHKLDETFLGMYI